VTDQRPQKKRRGVPLKPLKKFNFELVGKRLQGLVINVDRDLQRRKKAARPSDVVADRSLSLLNMFIRFTDNSYRAVLYVAGDLPEDPNRKPSYVLVVPAINRQLLDLLFTVVYMLDELPGRSLEYLRAGWREHLEEYKQNENTFGADPEWRDYFALMREDSKSQADRLQLTPKERQNPKLIPYWKHPFQLKDEQTKSRECLRYLDKWVYGDVSAQAHLSCFGLLKVAPMILAPLIGGEALEMTETRVIPQYRSQHIMRTAVVTLAIATDEITPNHFYLVVISSLQCHGEANGLPSWAALCVRRLGSLML
jgi:hypothetical protein